MFEIKHNWNKVLPSQLSPKSTVTGIHSWSHVSWKQGFLKKSLYCQLTSKMCVRFPHWDNVYCTNVQQSNDQLQNCVRFTANSSIIQEKPLINEMTTRTVVIDICYLPNIWCTKQCEREKNISNSKKNVQLGQVRSLFSQKFTTTEQ